MPYFKDWLIIYKVLAIGLLVVFTVTFIVGWWSYQSQSKLMVERSNSENDGIYQKFVAFTKGHIGRGRNFHPHLQAELKSVMGRRENILLLEITDKSGRILASTNEATVGRMTPHLSEHFNAVSDRRTTSTFLAYGRDVRQGQPVSGFGLFDRRHKAQEFVGPLFNMKGELIGVIHIYLSVDRLFRSVVYTVFSLVGIMLLSSAIGITILLALIRRYIDRPLHTLEETANEVALGRISKRARIESKDEIGRLATSFNLMADSLVSTQFQADTDGLTGLHNYRHFQQYISGQIAFAQRYNRSFSLAIADLDHFKEVNDRYGHTAGDEILRIVAAYLTAQARETDYVARYGGEEFAIVMPEINGADATTALERLRVGFPEAVYVKGGSKTTPIFISIGVADFPKTATDTDSLIAAADAALLFAKRRGRNQVAYYGKLPAAQLEEQDIERLYQRLRRAQRETIEALATAVDARLGYDAGHSNEIGATAAAVARAFDMGEEESSSLSVAAKMRDIGVLSVAPGLLKKSGALTPDELMAIRKSPVYSERILKASTELTNLVPIVLYHHERWDGTGYPEGLKREKIPLGARVLAVAEVYYAMISERPYRKSLTKEQALSEIKRGAGTQFDPDVVKKFVALMSERKAS